RLRASLRNRISKIQLARGSTEAACQFQMGALQKSDAPALQAGLNRSVTGRPPPFHCGENEIQSRPITSASVGATPPPLPIFREVIRLPDCKSGVFKHVSEATNWSVTSTSHH